MPRFAIVDLFGFSEIGGQLVEILLLPVVEGVVVTHRAADLDAEKCLRGGGGEFHGVGVVPEDETDGGVGIGAAGGTDQFADELIVGFFLGEGAVDVGEELVSAFDVGADAEHVGHENGPAVGEAGVGEELSRRVFRGGFPLQPSNSSISLTVGMRPMRSMVARRRKVRSSTVAVVIASPPAFSRARMSSKMAAASVADFGMRSGMETRLMADRFPLGENEVFGPKRAGLHPSVEQGDLSVVQSPAFVRHDSFIDGTEVDADEEFRWPRGRPGRGRRPFRRP